MSRVAYADGQYVPHRSASVHLEDRGYQFADGAYKMLAVVGGRASCRRGAAPHPVGDIAFGAADCSANV
jgi:branched-subunit amino acid aminotransferase/4-amino-4-deoxychorismate lyase